MSALQREMLRTKLPSMPPLGPSSSRHSRGPPRRRDYTPVKWDQYFAVKEDVTVNENVFRVYRNGTSGPVLLFLHGGGYCGLTWATLTTSLSDMVECQVAAVDLRGHGESYTSDDDDLSAETLSNDVGNIVAKLFGESPPPIILVGHSMGGAVAVHIAYRGLIPSLAGLAVIDVVEGTAMEALQSMQSFLHSRPSSFKSLDSAIEWCVRSGQVRNIESAKVSMPGQIKNSVTGKSATADIKSEKDAPVEKTAETVAPMRHRFHTDNSILEAAEEEELAEENDNQQHPSNEAVISRNGSEGDGYIETNSSVKLSNSSDVNFTPPLPKPADSVKYVWRIDLSKTEKYWSGWFQGLSEMYLSCNVPKMLLLAGVDRLDRELTIGQMQGKFQMQVLPQCGHAVHEDVPDKVADVLANFMVRHKFVQPTANFHPTFPGC